MIIPWSKCIYVHSKLKSTLFFPCLIYEVMYKQIYLTYKIMIENLLEFGYYQTYFEANIGIMKTNELKTFLPVLCLYIGLMLFQICGWLFCLRKVLNTKLVFSCNMPNVRRRKIVEKNQMESKEKSQTIGKPQLTQF